jgi:hypothetical protein
MDGTTCLRHERLIDGLADRGLLECHLEERDARAMDCLLGCTLLDLKRGPLAVWANSRLSNPLHSEGCLGKAATLTLT